MELVEIRALGQHPAPKRCFVISFAGGCSYSVGCVVFLLGVLNFALGLFACPFSAAFVLDIRAKLIQHLVCGFARDGALFGETCVVFGVNQLTKGTIPGWAQKGIFFESAVAKDVDEDEGRSFTLEGSMAISLNDGTTERGRPGVLSAICWCIRFAMSILGGCMSGCCVKAFLFFFFFLLVPLVAF